MEEKKQEQKENFWIGKKVYLTIEKDGHKLHYTAIILDADAVSLTFRDRDNKIFCFNRDLVIEMQLRGEQ